ncbi:GNAT family N-acetyltransferase [Actinophytocola glycyrrhizae]|uniref:GNAT family N-acetyltransferase n=1 Tax=Actinophytocola glycyrrhizae TaxID=2044873 RepID=A0ABV9RZS4_9PSEU
MALTFPDDVPTLTDGEITLRVHTLSDVDDVVVQCTDPESIRWTTVPVPYQRADAVGFVNEIVPSGWLTGKDLNFAIEAPHADGTRRFSGSIALRPMEAGVAELAFGLHPGVRGRGVCSRAVKLILDWGFSRPDIELIVWYAHVGNWASWRVAWANGFSYDGKVAKFLLQRGERHDAWCGSLRADDTREPKHEWHVPPTVETGRLRLRPHADADSHRFVEMMTDERSRHFGGRYSWLNDMPPVEKVLLRPLEADARGERFDWTIADRATDELIGHIQLFNLGGLDKTAAEIGYAVHPDARGKGVLTEALRALVECSFTDRKKGGLGLRRLSLGTAASNTASRHGAEKAGFTHVASLPESFPTGAAGFEDEVVYALVNPNWTELSTADRVVHR